MWNLKKHTNELTKQKQTWRTYAYQGDGRGGGLREIKEFGIDMYSLLCLKWVTNSDLLHRTDNSAQYCFKLIASKFQVN